MNIAQSLSKLMKERGLSRSALARALGVHTTSVSRWLDGYEAKPENLSALCEFFGCSLDYLAGSTERRDEDQGKEEHIPHEQFREVIAGPGIRIQLDSDASIDEERLKQIVDFIRFQQEQNGR